MNKEYIYHEGEVIIKDENNNQTLDEYYDNLDEVLVQENVIETMENKIQQLEKDSEMYKVKKHHIPLCFIAGLLGTLAAPLFMYWLGDTTIFTSTMNTIFGTMNSALFNVIYCSIVFLPLTSIIEIFEYKNCKNYKNMEKGTNSELEYLKKQIVKEKEKLDNLKKDKTREKENKEFRVVEVNDLERLKLLKQHFNLYYDLGYNGKKYYKYYQEGKLEEKLKTRYTKEGLEIVEEYLQEKGPTLVKKKKKNIH